MTANMMSLLSWYTDTAPGVKQKNQTPLIPIINNINFDILQ